MIDFDARESHETIRDVLIYDTFTCGTRNPPQIMNGIGLSVANTTRARVEVVTPNLQKSCVERLLLTNRVLESGTVANMQCGPRYL